MKKWTDSFQFKDLLLFEDENYLALNKPPGINIQADQTGDYSFLDWAIKEKNEKLHLINRLDRPVSGVVLFGRSSKHRTDLSIVKKYLAFVKPIMSEFKILTNYIRRDGRSKKAIISDELQDGFKHCQLQYQLVKHLENYSLIEIELTTGRFHQIRAQLSHIGAPIRGDVKYRARRSNKDRSIDLHAHEITIKAGNHVICAMPIGREKLWNQLMEIYFETKKTAS